jgi:Sulfotransferase family
MLSKTSKPVAPVFVVGPFRSGTSLLYALLNQHPKIALMYECDVWDFPDILSGWRFRRDWRTRLEFYGRAFSRHRLVFGDSFRGLENVRTPEDLYRTFAENKDALLFGEKSPFYCNRLCQLAKKHPDCSFILIWRDPVEVYRSVEEAGYQSRFFRRPGILNRLIFYQEQMIHEAARLRQTGNRVHHITYPDLVDHTEESCRRICQFLNIEFDEKMLDLEGADLSAVHRSPPHEYLRRGKIARRKSSNNGANPRAVQKLQRFHHRWNRLTHQLLGHAKSPQSGSEPSLPEFLYHRLAGSFLCFTDSAKRALFEFLPLPWLRTYRQVKAWFMAGYALSRSNRRPLGDEFLANKATILLGIIILAVVAVADYVTGVGISLMPFYVIPSAVLTLVIGQRWGTFAAMVSALTWSLVQNIESPWVNFSHPGIWLWDLLMHFSVLEIIVVLLGRIRVEVVSQKNSND